MRKPTILIADNSADYRKSLLMRLKLEGYTIAEAESVEQAITALADTKPDVALIDLRLTDDDDTNDMSGLEVAKTARDMDIPCIIITAFPSVDATRLALRSRGAEPLAVDFVAKSSGPEALLDTIRAVLSTRDEPQATNSKVSLTLDLKQRLVWRGNEALSLSDRQYELLELLASQPGRVFTAAEVMKAVYDEKLSESDARMEKKLERLIERTREKIEADAKNPQHLVTVWGRGYRLILDP